MTRVRRVVNGRPFVGVFALHPTNKAEEKGEAVPGFWGRPTSGTHLRDRELEIALVQEPKCVQSSVCVCPALCWALHLYLR